MRENEHDSFEEYSDHSDLYADIGHSKQKMPWERKTSREDMHLGFVLGILYQEIT